jgi:hypothetical protein
MPGIDRRVRFGILDVTDFAAEEKPTSQYCHRCREMFGVNSVVGPRIMPLDKTTGKPIPKPADYDNWLECHNCGTVYGKYEVKQEADVTTLIEPDANPFDRGLVIESVRESRKADRSPLQRNAIKKKHKKVKEQITDPDILREMKGGGTILNYTISKE